MVKLNCNQTNASIMFLFKDFEADFVFVFSIEDYVKFLQQNIRLIKHQSSVFFDMSFYKFSSQKQIQVHFFVVSQNINKIILGWKKILFNLT